MPALFIDLSSNNPIPDLKKYWDAGYRTLALKATEGTTYTWDRHADLSDKWHALGGKVWHYHFARPGHAVTQVDHFLSVVHGHVVPSQDRLVLDCEVQGVDDAFVDAFFTRVHAKRPNMKEEIYGSYYFLKDTGIKPHHEEGLWLAEYGPKADIPPGWTHWDAWQYTDKAKVPGESGLVDQSHLRLDPVAPAKSLPKWTSGPPLKRGDRGWRVMRLKWRLWHLGYHLHSPGPIFGASLDKDVRHFQKTHKLTVDGIVGSRTIQALFKEHLLTPEPAPAPAPAPTPVVQPDPPTPTPVVQPVDPTPVSDPAPVDSPAPTPPAPPAPKPTPVKQKVACKWWNLWCRVVRLFTRLFHL